MGEGVHCFLWGKILPFFPGTILSMSSHGTQPRNSKRLHLHLTFPLVGVLSWKNKERNCSFEFECRVEWKETTH